jgi:hypothetical protein
MDSLKKELWNENLAKKRKKTQQIELRQAQSGAGGSRYDSCKLLGKKHTGLKYKK